MDEIDKYIRWIFRIALGIIGLSVLGIIAIIYIAATTSLADVGAAVGEAVKAFNGVVA